MASEIRVNRLSNRSGLSTITFANGGVQFSGITTFANGDFRVGTGATIMNPSANEMQFHTGGSNRFTINNSGANLGTGNITAVDATFTGNVSIGKTLTYEDVKNVDSVGVVTARTGVKITGGDFTVGTAITASSVTGNVTQDVGITTFSGSAVWFKGATANKDMYWSHASGSTVYKNNAQILMGDNSDLQLYYNGSNSIIDTNTGDLILRTDADDIKLLAEDDIVLRDNDDSTNFIHCINGGAVKLYNAGNEKLATTSTGISVTGTVTGSEGLVVPDDKSILIGNDSNLYIKHSHGHSNNFVVSSVGDIEHHMALSKKIIKGFNNSGTPYVNLYQNNNIRLTTTSQGTKISGGADTVLLVEGTSTASRIDLKTSNHHRFWQTLESDGRFRLYDQTNAAERFTITSAGNVGINSTIPGSQLVVKATTDDNPALTLYRQSTGGDIASLVWQTSAGSQAKINYRGAAGASEGMQFYTAGGSSSQLRMIIDHSGNIGLGHNDPDQDIHIKKSSQVTYIKDETTHTNSTYTGLNLKTPTLNFQIWNQGPGATGYSGSNSVVFWQASNTGPFAFYHGNDERLRIGSDGAVVIRHNGATASDGYAGLEVRAASDKHQIIAASSSNAANSNYSRIGFKLHPSGQNERIKAAIECQGSGGGYGEVDRMMFCIDNVADNGSAAGNGPDEKLRIDQNGRLLIGTQKTFSAASYYDDITINNSNGSNATGGTGITLISSTNSWASILLGDSDDHDVGAIKYDHNTNSLRFVVNTIDPAVLIDSSGRVLIGTTTEGHADADDLTIAATNPGITLRSATNGSGSIFFSDATSGVAEYDCFAQFYHSTRYFRFGINNDEKLRITSTGQVFIGDSDAISAAALLHLYQASNDPYINIQRGSGDAAVAIGGISWKNSSITTAGIYGYTDDIDDGTLRFHTAEGGTNTEKLHITKGGAVVIQREHLQIQRAGNNTANFTKGGLIFATPAYNEYHYTWSGQSSYTIDLTCGSYFHCEFIYTQHQTNGGNEMHYYARGKWANNHHTHTGYMYELSGDGAGLSVSFTVSDTSGNGSVDMKAGATASGTSGATYRGLYGGGSENTSTTANGRLRIAESYSWGSVSSRCLIVRQYYGSFSISKS